MSTKTRSSSVRFKIITIIALCIGFLSIFIYFISIRVFQRSYSSIEQDQAVKNTERVSDTIDNNLAQLNIRIVDWAWWDDTYKFMKDGNKSYIESNLGVDSISNIKINSMVFVDMNHKITFSKSLNYNTKEEMSPESIDEHVRSHEILSTNTNEKSTKGGIIVLPEGPMLITTSTILTSDSKGPILGTLIFGKSLDNNLVREISKLTHLPVSIYDYDDKNLPADVLDAKNKSKRDNSYIAIPVSGNIIAGYKVIKDIYGEPALILKVETTREVYSQGLTTLNSFLTISIAAIFILGLIMIILIESFFIYRFSRLNNEVKKIGESKNFEGRVTAGGKDGIGELAAVINSMLVALSNSLMDVEGEEKILESQALELEKFKLVIENTTQHIIITNTEGVVIYSNPAASHITGYSKEEILGSKPSLWGRQMPAEFYVEMWNRIKKEKKTFEGEILNKRKNGETYTAKALISPVIDVEGNIKFFVGLETDISKEKALELQIIKEKESVEQKVVDRTRELKEERARLLSSINSIPFGFIIVDVDNHIIMKNKVMVEIFKIDDQKDLTLDDFTNLLGDNLNIKTEIKRCTREKITCELENIVIESKTFRGIIAPIITQEDSEIIGYVFLLEDITEAKILERSKEEFFAVASHELRTPLTAIRGNSDMLIDMFKGKSKDKDASEMLVDINEASKRLIGIVNDFLDASRLEQGKIIITNKDFNIEETVEEVVKSIKEEADKKKLELIFKKAKDLSVSVYSDQDKIKQILFNIIGNAIKFTDAGSITVSAVASNGFVKISVTDTGAGISAKNENLLFRKFQPAGEQVLARDVTKSTGLGLYISRLLISKMGGTIGLERSTVGEGSTFFFTVPIKPLE